MSRITSFLLVLAALAGPVRPAAAQPAPGALHRPFDQLLDTHVRDGFVYYRALRSERRALDGYLAALERAAIDGWSREDQIAFWLNAYNAIVIDAVVRHYPIRGTSRDFPANSIRQVPGVFERTKHRIAGRPVTLDTMERDILGGFGDPRVFLALGRGSVGGGRLRSEAFAGPRLEEQLRQVAAEFTTRHQLMRIDVAAQQVSVTPLLSWREQAFAAAYADRADARFSTRSPIERALVALILPHVLPAERGFIEANQFKVVFHDYDWRLNDLTGGAPR